jgi:hypothetical protein
MIGRIAFYGVRAASRNGQQQGPPRQFGIFGKTFWGLVFVAVYVHWWRGALCITAAFVIVLTLFVLAHMGSGKGKRAVPPSEGKGAPGGCDPAKVAQMERDSWGHSPTEEIDRLMREWAGKP